MRTEEYLGANSYTHVCTFDIHVRIFVKRNKKKKSHRSGNVFFSFFISFFFLRFITEMRDFVKSRKTTKKIYIYTAIP